MKQSLSPETKNPEQILNKALGDANKEFNKDKGKSSLASINVNARRWVNIIGQNSEKQKAVISALTTSLTKKIETPSQDIRYHKVELAGGYSGRTFDTKYVTPFFKEHFPRIAMKESGWLTRSIEQAHPFTLQPLFPGKIRDKQVKDAFLQILNDLESNAADPYTYLVALFVVIISKHTQIQTLLKKVKVPLTEKEVEIDRIIGSLKLHFFSEYHSPGASKLPVIAVYSIYKIIVNEISRYQDMKLLPLKSHVAPDVRAGVIGDVEVVDKGNKYFEALEIKHNIPISVEIIEDAYRKFKTSSVRRYYLLTTAEPYFVPIEEAAIRKRVQKIRKEHGCEVIINGIVPSLKYYLRLVSRPERFVKVYSDTLKMDISKAAEIKEEHLKKWIDILTTFYEISAKIQKTLGKKVTIKGVR